MKLPQKFTETMKALLDDDADAFFASYDKPKTSGLRCNGLKLDEKAFRTLSPYARTPIPWVEGAFYTEEEDKPGKHPHYHAGLYYIQEPSAMVPAELLGVKPGHKVLDLCAAPGGKTTQLAAKLQGSGCLVTNDNAAERTKALVKNVELAGVANAIVLNEEPSGIAAVFGAFFDRVLVDAPCSGEGMFRKDESMAGQWEKHAVEKCALMQHDIMAEAAKLVAPGGRLLYSTCTFSPRENEGTIARFIADFPEFTVVQPELKPEWGFTAGRPDWLNEDEAALLNAEQRESLARTVRIWPHLSRGEGHFAALLERSAAAAAESQAIEVGGFKQRRHDKRGFAARPAAGGQLTEAEVREKFDAFVASSLADWQPRGNIVMRGNLAFLQPELVPDLTGLRNVIRPGWLLGAANKHRFEPSQALAMGLRREQAARSLLLDSAHPDCGRYLRGDTLQPDAASIVDPSGNPAAGKGWTLVCVDGFPVGWGRWDGAILKNELLPGWRRV